MCFSPLWSGVFLNVIRFSKRMKVLLYSVSFCPLKSKIAETLTRIFNQSLTTGIFLDEWKFARVTPLYKNSGKRSDPRNYRPISVIPVVAKVFERIIYDQLYHYLTKNNFLSCHQSGFRS